MTIINVMVDDQRLEFSSMPVVASEGVKETYVKFALSSDWSGFGATAMFYRDDSPEDVYTSVLDGAGLAEVPYEITAAPGWIRFGLSGSDGTSVHTSEILKYKVVKGKYTSGQSSEPPAPGIYEQMLAIAGQMRDTLNASVIEQNAIIQGLVSDMDDLRSDMETEQTTFESVVTGQINTLVNNFAGSSRETVLFEGSHTVNIGDEIDLVSDPTVYDYLDIVLNDGMVGTIIGPTQNSQWRVTGETVKSTGASVTTYVIEGVLDAQSLCLRVSTACAIVDTGTASTRYDLSSGPIADESLRRYCLKVIGRKLTDDAEVLNIRVGADGVTYQTAGTAVRSQLGKKLNAPISGGTVDYGTSGQLLATDGQGNTEWVDSVIPDGSITVAKLAPGVIDTTYLIQGAAAESVTVGQSLASKASAADVTALDTRVTGVESDVSDLKEDLNKAIENFAVPTQEAVNNWLDVHPEATTTVLDGSLTYKKLVNGTLGFVTPEMYGAKGDGTADDSTAITQAIGSGFPVNLGGKVYAVTSVITLANGTIFNGTLKLIGVARIYGSNLNLFNVAFDMTNKTEPSQIALKFTGGNNIVKDCSFSSMVAQLFAYQIDASNCNIHVDGCSFETVRVLEINGQQSDNSGSARHIVANLCDVVIENCVFNGFYEEDDNFFEDSDCIYVTRCEHAVISNNLFKGNWKSAIKNQYANVIITDNTFLPTKSWYVIRSHTEAVNALITNNIIAGACDVCFYLTSGKNTVCNNHIDLSVNQLVFVANAEVIFNDNCVNIESNGGLHRTYTASELAVFITSTGTSLKIESNSDITCDNHFPYIFARETTLSNVKMTGKITTENTSTSVLYDLTGEIRTDKQIAIVTSNDLIVRAYGVNVAFNACENIEYYSSKQSKASSITNCKNIYASINFVTDATYTADITNSQNVIIKLTGASVNYNIVAVNDSDTTGIAVNYINNRQNIYNRNSVTLAYVAKSMYV